MHKLAFILAASTALASSAAHAEGLGGFDWTGFYAGVHGGYALGVFEPAPEADLDFEMLEPQGYFYGARIGADVEFADLVVVGVSVSGFHGANISDSISQELVILDPAYIDVVATHSPEYFGTALARAGIGLGGIMPYVTGGVAVAQGLYSVESTFYPDGVNGQPNSGGTARAQHIGWAAGGGIELAVTDSIAINVEYLYADLGTAEYVFEDSDPENDPFEASLKMQTLSAGLNLRF